MNPNHGSRDVERPNQVCEEIWFSISLYADGEASEDETARVDRHLAQCEECTRELKLIRVKSAVLRDVPLVLPPPHLREAIFAATINRRSVLARAAAAIGQFAPSAPARYGAVALGGALAAYLFVAMRPGTMPVLNPVPSNVGPQIADNSQAPIPDVIAPPSSRDSHSISPQGPPRLTPHPTAKVPLGTVPAVLLRGNRIALTNSTDSPRNPAVMAAGTGKDSAKKPGSKSGQTQTVAVRNDFKLKPLVNPPGAEEPMPMTVSKEPETKSGMVPAVDMKEIPLPMPGETEKTPPAAPATIRLISGSVSPPADQAASLAGLKQALKSQRLEWNTNQIKQSLKDKQIRIDVIRGSF